MLEFLFTCTYAYLCTSTKQCVQRHQLKLCCVAVWKRLLPRLRGTVLRACLVASILAAAEGAGGSVGDAVGAPTGAATAARVRFCLSGGIRHWEVDKQLFRICAVYVRIFHWQNFGSLYIQVEYVLIRTYTYMYVYRTYSVCIRTYIVRISYVYVRILALYVRYTNVYVRYTCIYVCVRIGIRLLV